MLSQFYFYQVDRRSLCWGPWATDWLRMRAARPDGAANNGLGGGPASREKKARVPGRNSGPVEQTLLSIRRSDPRHDRFGDVADLATLTVG